MVTTRVARRGGQLELRRSRRSEWPLPPPRIIADTGSPRLVRAYSAAQSEIQLCLAQLRPTFEHPSQESAEHHVLLDALVSGDVAAAERAFRQHWHDSMESLLRILEAASTSEAGSASPEVAQALPKDLAGSEE